MAIGPEGTFAYSFVVSEDHGIAAPLRGTLSRASPRDVPRLVGHAPMLDAVEFQREPWQLYARLTLTASDRWATVRSASITVERGIVRVLRRGDVLHLRRTASGGLGLSILREDQLIAAAGAITSVPLGSSVSARYPRDLIAQAEAIFRTRDENYHLFDRPLELAVAGATRILHSGRPQMGPYEVYVRHGFILGLPGIDESASIEQRAVCPDTAAHTTAQLLEEENLEMHR